MKKNQEEQKTSKAGKVANVIVNVFLVLVLIFAFICTYTAFTTKKGSGVPNLFGNIFLSIQSDSMAPTFEKGDMIFDKEVKDPSTLQVGDVITFWTIIDGQRVLNTHRIVEIEGGDSFIYFYTKGDNNNLVDGLTVHESEVVGKYSSKIKGLGNVFDFLQTSKGFLIVIVLPVLAFFIYYLVVFFKSLSAYKTEKNRLKMEAEIEVRTAAALAAAGTQTEEEPKVEQAAESQTEDEKITLTKDQLMQLLKQAGVTQDGEALDGEAEADDTKA